MQPLMWLRDMLTRIDTLGIWRSADPGSRAAWFNTCWPWINVGSNDPTWSMVFGAGWRTRDVAELNWRIWDDDRVGETPPAIPWNPPRPYLDTSPFIWIRFGYFVMPGISPMLLAKDLGLPLRTAIKPPRCYNTGKSRRRQNLPRT